MPLCPPQQRQHSAVWHFESEFNSRLLVCAIVLFRNQGEPSEKNILSAFINTIRYMYLTDLIWIDSLLIESNRKLLRKLFTLFCKKRTLIITISLYFPWKYFEKLSIVLIFTLHRFWMTLCFMVHWNNQSKLIKFVWSEFFGNNFQFSVKKKIQKENKLLDRRLNKREKVLLFGQRDWTVHWELQSVTSIQIQAHQWRWL